MVKLAIPNIEGRAISITGASIGTGVAPARAFADQGACVGLHDHSGLDSAVRRVSEIRDRGGNVVQVRGDASRSGGDAADYRGNSWSLGRPDGLVNNAGGMVARVSYQEMTDAIYDVGMDLNARSVLAASTAAIPTLRIKKRGGFIINTTSIAAQRRWSVQWGRSVWLLQSVRLKCEAVAWPRS